MIILFGVENMMIFGGVLFVFDFGWGFCLMIILLLMMGCVVVMWFGE